MSATSTSPITTDPDGSQHQKQHVLIDQLVERVQKAPEPPIAEIQAALQKYICAKVPPANTPSPSYVQDKRTVELAVHVCEVIGGCKMHFRREIAELDTCFSKAWPGIWRWMQFINDQCCQRDRYGCKKPALISIFSALYAMAVSVALRNEVTSTPGVITMVAGYWKDQGRYPDIETMFEDANFSNPFPRVLNMLLEMPEAKMGALRTTPNYILELIATFGSAKAVATHAIKHLKVALEANPPNFRTIWAHITLINGLSFGAAPKIALAMLDQGTIPMVVRTILWMAGQSRSRPKEESTVLKCMESCFVLLMNGMMVSNGPLWASQALDAGILSAILKSAPRLTRSSECKSSSCSSLLSNILCQYLVYKSVVRSAAKGLRKVERLELDGGSGGPIWEAWGIFKTLVLERVAIKKRSDQSMANRKVCGRMDVRLFHGGLRLLWMHTDNVVKCRASTDHDELLRCGGCLQEFYCDRECQRMDWPSHKSKCQRLQRLLRDGIQVDISPADRAFISDIIATEITDNRTCLEKLILALDSSPVPERTPSDFVFSLDYTQVPVNIKVISVAELKDGKDFWKADWDPLLKQALQSDGKCMLANAQVQRGGLMAFTTFLMPAPIQR